MKSNDIKAREVTQDRGLEFVRMPCRCVFDMPALQL